MYVRAGGEEERLRMKSFLLLKIFEITHLNDNFKTKKGILTHNVRSEALEIILLSNMRLRPITAAPFV